MPTFSEILPPSKSSPNAAIRWTPAEGDYEPIAGVLRIDSKRSSCEYRLTEFPIGFQGRGFQLDKITTGTDAEAEGYACFVPPDTRAATCECKGFLRWGGCKHVSALAALLANDWI